MVTPNLSLPSNSLKLLQPVTFQLTQLLPPVPLQETSQDGDLDIQKLLHHQLHQSTGLSHQPNQPDQDHSEAPMVTPNLSLLLPQIIQFSQLVKLPELTLMDQFQDSENHTISNKISLLLPQIIQFSQQVKLPELTLMDQFQDSENHTLSNKNQVSSQVILLPPSHQQLPDGLIKILSNKSQVSNQEILLPPSHQQLPDGLIKIASNKNQEFNQVI